MRTVALALLVALAVASYAVAQEAAPAPNEAPAREAPTDHRTFYELRFTVMTLSTRWSRVGQANELLVLHAERSLYFGPGIGARFFIKQPHHGFIVDFDYLVDTDVDSLNSESKWRTDVALARVGYAYRFIRQGAAKMTWAFTLHGGFSAGGSINRSEGGFGGPVADAFSPRSAVIGGRVGVNVDIHIQRFFMGWALEYEGLRHVTGAPLESSHLVRFTLVPVFRVGVDLGPKVQSI